ncbi:acidic proline-rich protein PRP25-like [Hirundo rustica]|uniref:acidic proline-rich protein PRP25-like n=1 Tax=Hirundo rustica TaxID=43150 RepID=UPI001A95021F|nr:acidic proline-rich protein PRP25-like [Hirundo rustica]
MATRSKPGQGLRKTTASRPPVPLPEREFHKCNSSAVRSSAARTSHPPANRTALGNLTPDPDPASLSARDPKEAGSQGGVPPPAPPEPLRASGPRSPGVPRYLRGAQPRALPREGHGPAGHRRPPLSAVATEGRSPPAGAR